MLNLSIRIEGKTQQDLELAVKEVLCLVQSGCTTDTQGNEPRTITFNRTGESSTFSVKAWSESSAPLHYWKDLTGLEDHLPIR